MCVNVGLMHTQQRSETTRAQLLKAAEACFSISGYDGASIADICQRAGVSKGAFYHHFPTKQALFLELLSRWLEGLDTQIARARQDAPNVLVALQTIAGMVHQVFTLDKGRLPIFLVFWMQAARDPEAWAVTIGHYRHYQALFAAMIAEGIAEGSIAPTVDADAAAQALVSLGVGLIMQGLLDPKGADWGRVAENSVRILLDGLRRRAS